MTWTHVLARIAVYFVAWVFTAFFAAVFFERYTGKGEPGLSLVLSTLLWMFILGIIYW